MGLLLIFYAILAVQVKTVVTEDEEVTCYSIIKLLNVNDGLRLHSHDVKYGSGSGQQSVTGVKISDDINSHWQIFPALSAQCNRGDPIKCGQKIRLKHLNTGAFLHSHHFSAPLSKSFQEVSAFGNENESDSGDEWTLLCSGEVWGETEKVNLRHVETGVYLTTSGQKFRNPISGQGEIVGTASIVGGSSWRVAEGIYIKHQQKDL